MKKSILFVFLAVASLVSPNFVSAHGHTSFEIKGRVYSFVLGSLNEPVTVDDKSGVDLRVTSMAHRTEGHEGTPVTGLEKTLQVELMAGDKTKVLNFSPAFGEPGAYQAYFIPTVQTTYSYRIFGTIDEVPFSYTWTCNPAGHPQTALDTSVIDVSQGVRRVELGGTFSCPTPRADVGFPEPSITTYDLNKEIQSAKTSAMTAHTFGIVGMTFGIIALAVSRKARKTKKE